MNKTHARLAAIASMTLASVTFSARAQKQTDPFKSNSDIYPLTSETRQEQAPPMARGQYPLAQSNESVQDFPATEVREVPVARAAAVKAKWEYYRAKDNLYSTVDLMKDDFEESGQAKTAKTARDTAHDQLDAVRQRVLGRLAQDPQYRALRKLRDQADQQVQQLRANDPQNSAPIAAAAQVKMEYARRVSEMEHDALLADPEYGEAKARLTVAGQDVTRIRSAFQRALVRGDEFREARKDWQDARIDYVVAVTYRNAVVDVANVAINYAYDLHYYDQLKYLHMGSFGYYPYSGNYGYGGVGYNYGVPVVSGHSSMFRY